MDSHRQEEEERIDDFLSTSDGEFEGEESQMTGDDDDLTQMSENDMTPNKNVASQIFPSSRARRRNRIASESDQEMGESSQHFDLDPNLSNLGQSSQECDSDSDKTEIFEKPVANAFERRRRSHVHLSASDSNGAESGDDYMSRASSSKSADITESQRSQRQRTRKYKQQSISDAFHMTQKLEKKIKKIKQKASLQVLSRKEKNKKMCPGYGRLLQKLK